MPDVHDRLREAAPAPTMTPDFEELWVRGRRHRRLARGGAIVGALTFIAAAIVAVPGLFDATPRPDVDIVDAPTPAVPPVTAESGWTQIAPSPLSPRQYANAFWTGKEVLVIGGSTEMPCPPGGSCPGRPPETPYADVTPSDGAAWDPASNAWRAIASAPVPIGGGTEGVVIDEVLYLWEPGTPYPLGPPTFWAYSVRDDDWEPLPVPEGPIQPHQRLVATGDHIVSYTPTEESDLGLGDVLDDRSARVYEISTRTWTVLPPDPLHPSYDRTLLWTGDRLVLIAVPIDDRPSSSPDLYRAAAYDFDTGAWTTLADSEVVGWDPGWFWVGGRIVNPSPGSSDGGDTNNWGRAYPHGGIYDPATDTWEALPPGPPIPEDTPVGLPPEPYGYGLITVAGDEYAVASGGWVLHVPTGTWQALAPPDGAPTQDMATVWAGDRLFLWGGARFSEDPPSGGLLDTGWTYVPSARGSSTDVTIDPSDAPTQPEPQTVTDADRELADRFVAFALDPGPDTASAVPFAPTVQLGLADQLLATRSAAEVADEQAWVILYEGFRAHSGPFSALEYVRSHVVDGAEHPEEFGRLSGEVQVNVGPHPHCASPPFPAPVEVSALRRVSIQPADDAVDTCLLWFTVDLFVNDQGEIGAVTLDIWEP